MQLYAKKFDLPILQDYFKLKVNRSVSSNMNVSLDHELFLNLIITIHKMLNQKTYRKNVFIKLEKI